MAQAESRRVVWRRRIAPIALLIAVGLLASRTCSTERSAIELSFDLGEAAAQVRELEVTVHREPAAETSTPLGLWTGRPGAAPLRPWRIRLDPGRYQLRFRAVMADGRLLRFTRPLDVSEEEARVSVSLAAELAAAPAVAPR
jgi:hypothetical protein